MLQPSAQFCYYSALWFGVNSWALFACYFLFAFIYAEVMEGKSFSLKSFFKKKKKSVWLTRYRQEILCSLKCAVPGHHCLTFTVRLLLDWTVATKTLCPAALMESDGSCFSYLQLLFSYLYWESCGVFSSTSEHLDDASGLFQKVVWSIFRAVKWILRTDFLHMLTGTRDAFRGILHASCPDWVGRGRDEWGWL